MSSSNIFRRVGSAILDALRPSTQPRTGGRPRPSRPSPGAPRTAPPPAGPVGAYPGDFVGRPELTYAPHPDRMADPGEIVWTWVPYEEDHTQGKDRPVLIIGRDRGWLLGLPLTSQDHDRDAAQEAGEGRYWVEIGTGDWDSSGRVSEVRVNRFVRVDPKAVRRVAGKLDQRRFELVAAGVRRHW